MGEIMALLNSNKLTRFKKRLLIYKKSKEEEKNADEVS